LQPLFANHTLQETRKLNQTKLGGGVQISLQVVNSLSHQRFYRLFGIVHSYCSTCGDMNFRASLQ